MSRRDTTSGISRPLSKAERDALRASHDRVEESLRTKKYEFCYWELVLEPAALPDGWRLTETLLDGAFYKHADGLLVCASAMKFDDGKFWLHVSCSRRDRLPSWADLRRVKDIWIGRDKTALQVLPPASDYVNLYPNVLHLWWCLAGDVTPDFTRGTGSV